jgi:hypothetical protein
VAVVAIGGRVIDALWTGGSADRRAGLMQRVRESLGPVGRRELAWGG